MSEEYIYSYNRNYVKWKVSIEKKHKMRYQYQIVTTRKLEGLLPADMYATDGEYALYYEISAMQNLEKWFTKEKVNRKWMKRIAEGLKTALWSLEQYLLDGRNLLWEPENIFVHMEAEKIYFVYFPYCIEEKQQNTEKFLTFLIENADETEADTVEVIYDIYAKWESCKEQFTWESFLHMWDKHIEKTEASITDGSLKEESDNFVTEENMDKEKSGKQEGNQPEESCQKQVCGKREIGDFLFGRHKYMNKKEQRQCVAMEQWEYAGEAENKESVSKETMLKQSVSRATIAENVSEAGSEREERKLYGNGKQNRRVLRLDSLPAIVGKKEGVADIVLPEPSVGIMHARFTEENGQVYLEDLNTQQGTYKNSVRLKPYEKVEILREDEIRLGRLEFTYR